MAAAIARVIVPAAPIIVPAAVLLVARILGATWPMAIVVACAAIPIVWYVVYERTWTS